MLTKAQLERGHTELSVCWITSLEVGTDRKESSEYCPFRFEAVSSGFLVSPLMGSIGMLVETVVRLASLLRLGCKVMHKAVPSLETREPYHQCLFRCLK